MSREKKEKMIIRIYPTKEQEDFAEIVIANRKKANAQGHFKTESLTEKFQVVGELIIHDLLKMPRNPQMGLRSDGGSDVILHEKRTDVKCERRTVVFDGPKKDKYDHNVNAGQINNSCDEYLFISWYEPGNFYEICGRVDKEKFIAKAIFYEEGAEIKRTNGSSLYARKKGVYVISHEHVEEFKRIGDISGIYEVAVTA
jgi:hypothetical protein